MFLLYTSIFSLFFISIKSDECNLVAVCNCTAKNETNPNGTDLEIDVCNPKSKSSTESALLDFANNVKYLNSKNESSLKYSFDCQFVDLMNHSTKPLPPINSNKKQLILELKYHCDAPPSPSPKEHHYSTGTVLIIIFFTILFAYLGMGIAVNYFLIGARGIELIPHISFWKDFPSLVRDGVKFVQNGCKARPSELNSSNPDSYDAI